MYITSICAIKSLINVDYFNLRYQISCWRKLLQFALLNLLLTSITSICAIKSRVDVDYFNLCHLVRQFSFVFMCVWWILCCAINSLYHRRQLLQSARSSSSISYYIVFVLFCFFCFLFFLNNDDGNSFYATAIFLLDATDVFSTPSTLTNSSIVAIFRPSTPTKKNTPQKYYIKVNGFRCLRCTPFWPGTLKSVNAPSSVNAAVMSCYNKLNWKCQCLNGEMRLSRDFLSLFVASQKSASWRIIWINEMILLFFVI